MLVALMDLCRIKHKNHPDKDKIGKAETWKYKVGDIIMVQKEPGNWGNIEQYRNLIGPLNDPDLEADMDANGETQRLYPYAKINTPVVSPLGDVAGIPYISNRCTYRADEKMYKDDCPGKDHTKKEKYQKPESKDYLEKGDLTYEPEDREEEDE